MSRRDTPWTPLEIDRPMGHLREIVGVSQSEAGALLGLPATQGTISTVSTAEQRGAKIQLGRLLARAEAYGLEVEIRVRKKRHDALTGY